MDAMDETTPGAASASAAGAPVVVDLAGMRRSYQRRGITPAQLDPDPFRQFASWLDDAVAARLTEPNAMTLATADARGRPSARTVLLKGLGGDAFVFYTNYDSRKARELAVNPSCCLVFPWVLLARQVVVTGRADRLSEAASDRYFATRPRGSQLGAWASPQSRVVTDRGELERRYRETEQRFDGTVPRPPHWGGFAVVPSEIEFWQGRPDRLHDRIRYRRDPGDRDPDDRDPDDRDPGGAGRWHVERLAP